MSNKFVVYRTVTYVIIPLKIYGSNTTFNLILRKVKDILFVRDIYQGPHKYLA